MAHDAMACRVTRAFRDCGVGWRFHGTPVDPASVEAIRGQGRTGFGPDWYRANRPGDAAGLARAREAARAYDPSRVFFSEHDIAPVPAPGIR